MDARCHDNIDDISPVSVVLTSVVATSCDIQPPDDGFAEIRAPAPGIRWTARFLRNRTIFGLVT